MEKNEFNKLLLDQFRVLFIDNLNELNDTNLVKAVTFNENLKSLGYSLKPSGIIKIAQFSDLDNMYNSIISWYKTIVKLPLYPNFPKQVMEIDESIYRFHQMMHYFSTYGIEEIYGVEVDKGWLPDVESTEKKYDDLDLLGCKTVDVINADGLRKLFIDTLNKRERLTIPEKEFLKHMILNEKLTHEKLQVTFKENIFALLEDDFESDLDRCRDLMMVLCQHSGDVLDFIQYELEKINYKNKANYYLGKHGHFKEKQKKMLVRMLEWFGSVNLANNLTLKRNRNLTCLRYLSYNRYSEDDNCRNVVSLFRNKDIRSWYSQVDKKIESYKKREINAQTLVDFIGTRPGELLRMILRLYRVDNTLIRTIEKKLQDNIDKLSMQTLIELAKYYDQDFDVISEVYQERDRTSDGFYEVLVMTLVINNLIESKLRQKDTPLKNKTIYLEEGNYDFNQSIIETNDKSEEGGYIRSGLAFKIPESVSSVRFFVYWNDKHRVDIDLHEYLYDHKKNQTHIGWNGAFRDSGVYMSGDITHSDAAEFIDVDIEKALDYGIENIRCDIDVFTRNSFAEIDEVFTGMMAVSEFGKNENVKLYNSKNVFFRHDLKSDKNCMKYCWIDLKNKCLKLIGSSKETSFTLLKYLDLLFTAQNIKLTLNKEEADIILSLDKQPEENSISLIDENYFM